MTIKFFAYQFQAPIQRKFDHLETLFMAKNLKDSHKLYPNGGRWAVIQAIIKHYIKSIIKIRKIKVKTKAAI